MKRTICIDFDGVIHAYSRGWHTGEIYDDPTPGAMDALIKLSNKYKIVILTTRADKADRVRQWLIRYLPDNHERYAVKQSQKFYDWLKEIEITDRKPPALVYIDDRALEFRNWAVTMKMIAAREEAKWPSIADVQEGWSPR